MPRSICWRHPKDKVIEIPIGAKYCERCRHLVLPEPEMEIVEIVQEMALEEELEPYVAPVDTSIVGTELPVIEATETPVEAEPEIVDVIQPIIVELPPEAQSGPILFADAALAEAAINERNAEIVRLKALLAKLEPETE